jgi:multiple sugar transport system permease protein
MTMPAKPGINIATRVDKVSTGYLAVKAFKATIVLIIAAIMLIPVIWMAMTAFKSRSDAVAVPPKVFFEPTMEGFISLLTTRRQLTETAGPYRIYRRAKT